jgi:hypothetical protein
VQRNKHRVIRKSKRYTTPQRRDEQSSGGKRSYEKLGTNTASRCSEHPTQHGARHPAREKKGRERKETKQEIHLHHTTRDTTRRSYHRVDLLGDDPDGVDDAGDPAEDGEHDGDQELNLQVQSQGTKQTALRNLNLASYYTVMHMHEHDGCERNGISGS